LIAKLSLLITNRYCFSELGCLKEKYKQIARFYQIHVEENDGYACRVTWNHLKVHPETGREKG